MKTTSLAALLAVIFRSMLALAQGSGQYAGTQCWINGVLTPVSGNTCPSSGSGSSGGNSSGGSSSAINSAAYSGLSQASYQLGYAFGQWLFGGGKNPQVELQKRLMMEELAQRQAEAERRHQEDEARRLAAMYARLNSTLKLTGLPDLKLKDVGSSGPELHLKLGDNADGQGGIKGLPGIYLNDGKVPYGIPGLPGMYTGGPGEGSGLSNSKLGLKLGHSDPAAQPAIAGDATGAGRSQDAPLAADNGAIPATETGLQLKVGGAATGSTPQAAPFDPNKMTPQQLADAAEVFNKLPPEEQQRLMSAGQNAGPGQLPPNVVGPASEKALGPLQQQNAASQAAAAAPALEDASAKARVGFDQAGASAPVDLSGSKSTPATLRTPGTAVTTNRVATSTPTTDSSTPAASGAQTSRDLEFLFPATPSKNPLQKDPNPPLINPLQQDQQLQAEFKKWDEWAVDRASHVSDPPDDPYFPEATIRAELNGSAVEQHAPELLTRYRTDKQFQRDVDLWLKHATQQVALGYYQGLAEAHKAALRAYQAELETLVAAGKLDRLVPLEDQYRRHPERRQLVQAAWARAALIEQSALDQARADGGAKLDHEYDFVFKLIRSEVARQAPGGNSQ
jgi:hypothetical protein